MARPVPPTRDPQTEGYVSAHMLRDGDVPATDTNGNYVVGPTHDPARETLEQDDVPRGTVHEFVLESTDSRIYPGIARDEGTFGVPDPENPARLIVTTSRAAAYSRKIAVYVPHGYVGGALPFIVGADGPDHVLFRTLDNLIHEGRVPPMVGISLRSGGGDAQGSQRGLEYDTMSGVYADFIESEVIPFVQDRCGVELTSDPDGRATMGCLSGASCAMSMAWYGGTYSKVLSLSGTYINQQWPWNPETPEGAWGYHTTLIPNEPARPIRIWMCVADRDLYNPNSMRDGMHDWVEANQRMAHVLADKGYDYQFSFVRNAWHCDPAMKAQLLPQALEWLWRGYQGG